MNDQRQYDWMVYVKCLTFNHAPFIVEAMNGFTMQTTDFPFVCTIVDDASTDGEPEILRKYLQDNFDLENKTIVRNEETNDYVLCFAQHKTNKNCYFAVFLLKYNHYRLSDGRNKKLHYVSEWQNNAKYIALCEGDDYWIASDKLQKQVEFLELHQDCTMVCNRTKLYSERKKKFVGENYCYKKSRYVNVKDVIYRTGLFISTCSIVYRKTITKNIPDYWRKCKVGDYPLQIMCAMKGEVYYFNDIMSVYRVENSGSWMGQQKWGEMDIGRLEIIKSRVDMFEGFSKDFPSYEDFFKRKIANEINRNISNSFSYKDIKQYKDFFFKGNRKIFFFSENRFVDTSIGHPQNKGTLYKIVSKPV